MVMYVAETSSGWGSGLRQGPRLSVCLFYRVQ